MFDWDDEELTNIIWGEEGETDDHIVPLEEKSEHNFKRKESDRTTSKPTDQRIHEDKFDHHCRKPESSSSYCANEEIRHSSFGLGSWPESSGSKAAEIDQDSIGPDPSAVLAEQTKYNVAKTLGLGKGPDSLHSEHESKEQGDFVDYSWASIGSFDDLDRIFSNDVPMFGDGSLGSADELWSSCKDATNSPLKPFTATLDSRNLRLDNPSFALNGGVNDVMPRSSQKVNVKTMNVEYPQRMNQPSFEHQPSQIGFDAYGERTDSGSVGDLSNAKKGTSKAYQQEKRLKFPKKLEDNNEARVFQELYGTWAPSENPWRQYESRLTPSMLESNPIITCSAGNLANTPVLSSIQSPDLKPHLLQSPYEVSPRSAISVNSTLARPLTLTPQEKIEKLRRKQQMQAMLAIQSQQQRFRHQVPLADQSITPKCPQDDFLQLGDGANPDNPTGLCFDSNSPLDQDDSSTVAAAINDNSSEYFVLYRLQDVIAKLDIGIRLCLRDSFVRLARSAVQRRYASGTTSGYISQDEQLLDKEEARKSNRYAGIPDAETETNPIDRTVAHLLFHRPLQLSANNPKTPESPVSMKHGTERKAGFSRNVTPDVSRLKHSTPTQGSKDSSTETQKTDQPESLDNTSSCGVAAGPGSGKAEASK